MSITPLRPLTVEYFTNGACHTLAIEIHKRTGWKLYVLLEPHDYGVNPMHALVKLPDGRYLDACGIQTREELFKSWPAAYLRRASTKYFEGWGKWSPKRACVAATRILEMIECIG